MQTTTANTIGTWVKDYEDFGLNADWSVSVYLVGDELTLLDNEDGTFTLYYQPELYWTDDNERSFQQDEIGTFEDHEVAALESAIADNE